MPVVVIGALTLTVTAPEFEADPLAPVKPDSVPFDSTAPPPPPTLCARMPMALTPLVVMAALLLTTIAPPFAPVADCLLPNVALLVAIAIPPPPPIDCATMPIAPLPVVEIVAALVKDTV